MYGKTPPRYEKKILAVFWSVVLAIGLLAFWHFASVHVESVKRVKESDGSIVYLIDVANPTNDDVTATVCLITGTAANDGAIPYGTLGHDKRCEVPAHDRVSVEIRFDPKTARFLGGSYSATICDADFK